MYNTFYINGSVYDLISGSITCYHLDNAVLTCTRIARLSDLCCIQHKLGASWKSCRGKGIFSPLTAVPQPCLLFLACRPPGLPSNYPGMPPPPPLRPLCWLSSASVEILSSATMEAGCRLCGLMHHCVPAWLSPDKAVIYIMANLRPSLGCQKTLVPAQGNLRIMPLVCLGLQTRALKFYRNLYISSRTVNWNLNLCSKVKYTMVATEQTPSKK